MSDVLRRAFESGLAHRPIETPAGSVLSKMVPVAMGSRSGSHEIPPAWVYRRRNAGLDMAFQFYWNFTKDDLICKVVEEGLYPKGGEGASVQFNANESVRVEGSTPVLFHHGRVTVRQARSRQELYDAMDSVCPRAMDLASIHSPESWPVRIGTADDLLRLLDRLFVYAYCIEQGKRRIEGLGPLAPLPDLQP